jgi:hypothetical protein
LTRGLFFDLSNWRPWINTLQRQLFYGAGASTTGWR